MQCVASRENIIYVMDVMHHQSEQALDILADTVLTPLFPEEELAESRTVVELQQEELPSEVFSRDLVQRAAYKSHPLGNTHFCPIDKVSAVNAAVINRFREQHYFGENCVVSVVGMDHASAVELVKKKFANIPMGTRVSKGLHEKTASVYTGGMVQHERTLKEPFVKLAMAFEVGGWSDSKLVPMCVLQQLLGGGSSFSAGGPGKGMYTRLYTQVLNRYYWTESVESFLSIHENVGLLGIDGACAPDKLGNLIQVIVQQFSALALHPVTSIELSRAKNMLKSSMMMQLESRLVQCEDIARQQVTYGKRDSPSMICAKIDAVTAEDVMAVAAHMLKHRPSVGCVGHDLSYLPSYDEIAEFTKQYHDQATAKAKVR